MPNHFHFVAPGELTALTGGYAYDRRIVEGARASGWEVTVHGLDGSFPRPTAAALEQAAAVLGAIPDGSQVVIDGLALGAMPALAEASAARLHCIALIHHPLAEETGLDARERARFASDERQALAVMTRVIVTSRHTARVLHQDYGVPRERIAVAEPGTATGTPGNWWTVFAQVPDAFKHTTEGFQFYRDPARKIDPRLRELGQIRAGWTVGSQFVFSHT